MPLEFSGIERRLDELLERLARLEPLRERTRAEFDRDPYLRDIVERNLEMAAQCVLDICHRIISLTQSPKPADYYGAILQLGELGVLPMDFSWSLAPLAGLRNILVHEYLAIDWNEVYRRLQNLDDLARFAEFVRQWLEDRTQT
ncbi:MAG: DUF86 domain-containing protein [Deltaproteobacteria bacterium]|nr:DUF86 domain-containing protein [Deltaproteobacteria bacterium]